MRSQRGFSLIEIMAALVILAIVITTTLAMFVDRQKHLREANEQMLAFQVLANEAEIWRRINFSSLPADTDPPQEFRSSLTLLTPLKPYKAEVTAKKNRDDLKTLTLRIVWNDGKRDAKLDLIRSDTGGRNLW
jgi:prepilin-type N-terminal cleavage/methylation domain-containing protein